MALTSCCQGACAGSGGVAIYPSCTLGVPATVTLTGPCAATADADSQAGVLNTSSEIAFSTAAAGPCHFAISLADGFAYAGEVTFAEQQPSSCGCEPVFVITSGTPSPIYLKVPPADCAPDAGDAADAATEDGGSDSAPE